MSIEDQSENHPNGIEHSHENHPGKTDSPVSAFEQPCATDCRHREVVQYLVGMRKRIRDEVARRDQILEGVNTVCTRLIRTRHWQSEIENLLRILGEASECDRTSIFRFSTSPDEHTRASLLYMWDKNGLDLSSDPKFQNLDVIAIGMGEMLESLRRGQPHYIHQQQRPPDKVLAKDTQTALNVPVYCKGELWGTFGFFMTRDGREWTPPELNALQIAADALSAAIERQMVEEAMRHSEERLRQALRLAKLGVWEWDLETDNVVWNDEMLAIFGISREEFTGKGSDYLGSTREDLRPAQLRRIQSLVEDPITEAELISGTNIDAHTSENCIVKPDGTETYIVGETISILNAEGRPTRMLGVALDITERKHAQTAMRDRDRLQVALEQEHQLNDIKTRLMRTITHEFRTPLTAILTSASLLETYYDRYTHEERLKKLLGIQNQVKNLNLIIGEVSRDVYDMFDPREFVPIQSNLELLCQTNVEEMQNTLGSKHMMRFVSDGQLRSAYVDERLVHRILINLLSNAIKYSPEGSEIVLHLSADSSAKMPTAIIEVLDQGIGVSEEEQVRLFMPFFRAANVGSVKGTGLGLSIVLDCVNQHRGSIHVQSQVGQGSVFTVRLPVGHVDQSAAT